MGERRTVECVAMSGEEIGKRQKKYRLFSSLKPDDADLARVKRLTEAVRHGREAVAEATKQHPPPHHVATPEASAMTATGGAGGMDTEWAHPTADGFAKRTRIVLLIVGFLFVGLIGRVFSLQIARHDHYAKLWQQSQLTIALPAVRGAIVDRHGDTYAITRLTGKSLFAVPRLILPERRAEVAQTLASVLAMDEAKLRERLERYADKQFVWLKRHLSENEEDALAAMVKADSALGFRDEMRRLYPQGTNLANVLGFVGADGVGLEGLEMHYEKLLHGTDGAIEVLRDARGRGIFHDDLPRTDPQHGATLHLTIDHQIQAIAEDELDTVMQRWKPKGAMVVVMNPHTGEVLAMGSRPTFDPSRWGAVAPENWRNRAIADAVEPGSIFKPNVMLAALEEGLYRLPRLDAPIPANPLEPIPGEDVIDCENGAWRIRSYDGKASRTLHEARNGFGRLPLSGVIIKSSNIGMAKVGHRLGHERLLRYFDHFGYGRKLGIDLPGEAAGIMPPTERYPEVYTIPSVTMGHSISVTPLQMLSAFNQIANGGYLLRPVVVQKAVGATGEIVHHAQIPEVLGRPLQNEAAREWMRKTLVRVCRPGGTARIANLDDYGITVAGKTGTAEKIVNGRYSSAHKICSFLAFAPADNPTLSVLVMVDEPTVNADGLPFYGGTVAGPPVRNIILRSLRLRGHDGN